MSERDRDGQASTTVRLFSNAVSCGKGNSGKSDGRKGRRVAEFSCGRSSRSSSSKISSLGGDGIRAMQ